MQKITREDHNFLCYCQVLKCGYLFAPPLHLLLHLNPFANGHRTAPSRNHKIYTVHVLSEQNDIDNKQGTISAKYAKVFSLSRILPGVNM